VAWLRLDDGFTKHPKFEGWTPAARWAWLEVMEYCARYETRGRIPTDLDLLPRSVTKQLLAKAEAAGWCDRDENGALWVHNWDEFNPPKYDERDLDQRVAEAFAAHPEASANDVVRMIGGQRKPALEAIRRFRTGSLNGSNAGSPEPEKGGSRNQQGTGSRAGQRARPRPVPLKDGALEVDAAVAANGLTAAATADTPQKKPWNRHVAEQLIRNAGYQDPHPDDLLHDTFDHVPDDELIGLLELASDLNANPPTPPKTNGIAPNADATNTARELADRYTPRDEDEPEETS
jgi:hypothetical protein